ncbi:MULTISPECIES: serine/threonine-protein kinase [unclassified Streptomyces]|uniref:serine/threonine-protein kinase n=1 Tax=unclassified Streptomyces TaxID=2593676 RepID=UPI001F5B540E|nr:MULTISPECIES: serine/threonine-protein kinase [unclassified Streptomyces]
MSEPTLLGPYRLLAALGEGGMGRVFLGAAHDGRLAAVKQVHPRFASDAGFRARFLREVAASRRVSGAYTAAVMDADAEAELPWLASVFVTGPSLGSAVRATGPLPETAARRLALGLATALVEIHRVGLIHRDLKPENVLLAEDGVRVIDFGIARAAEPGGSAEPTQLTQTGWVIGSPPFMSPEQAESRELTPASDVFSLGAILVLALTGASPFAGASTFQTLYNVVQGAPDLSGVPEGLRGIVEECLAKDPAARPTPARLVELLGPVPPAARVWPAAVHAMVTEQRSRIGALLGEGPEPTAVVPAQQTSAPAVPVPTPAPESAMATVTAPARVPGPSPAPGAAPQAAPPAVPAPAVAPVPAPAAFPAPSGPQDPPRGRRRGRTLALVSVAVLLVAAGAGVGGYFLLKDPSDSYLTLPTCEKAASRLSGYEWKSDQDVSLTRADGPETRCYWTTEQSGGTGEKRAEVWWNLKLTTDANGNATKRQHEEFAAQSTGGRPASAGLGDEAYWAAPSDFEDCSLRVRDGNLVLHVALGGEKEAAEKQCEPEAENIARTMLSASR